MSAARTRGHDIRFEINRLLLTMRTAGERKRPLRIGHIGRE
jgi:hypothetical protein